MPMLGGLPQFVIRAAKTPKISPARIIRVLGIKNRRIKTPIQILDFYVPIIGYVMAGETRSLMYPSNSGHMPHSAHPLSPRSYRYEYSTHSEPPETGTGSDVISSGGFVF